MPFDGNRWNEKKMISYTEMLETIRTEFSIQKLPDHQNDTSKVINLTTVGIELSSLWGTMAQPLVMLQRLGIELSSLWGKMVQPLVMLQRLGIELSSLWGTMVQPLVMLQRLGKSYPLSGGQWCSL